MITVEQVTGHRTHPTAGKVRASAGRQIRGETRDPVVRYIADRISTALTLAVTTYLFVAVVSWYAGRGDGYMWHGFLTDQVQAISLALGAFGAVIGLASLRAIVIDRS